MRAIVLISIIVLIGCGEADSITESPPGVWVDTTGIEWLRTTFEAVKACTQLTEGAFENITVVIMEPQFKCPHYPSGCAGEYVPPKTIKIAALSMFPHEVIHYLLDKKDGNQDPEHLSELFNRCGR